MPSTGRSEAFSFTSAKSLPSAPAEWIAMARTPASGPIPIAKTKTSASRISGTPRQISRNRREIQ
jgi:hypothetical protein